MLGGCMPQNIAGTVYDNREALARAVRRPMLVNEARNLTLLRSGAVFYPDTQPIVPGALPALEDVSINLIGSIMNVELERIRNAQRVHAAMLGRAFPGHDALRVPMHIVPTDNGVASAQADTGTGAVMVDVRIIQAAYRAALIMVFAAEDDLPSSVDTPAKREAYAFNAFANYRARLRRLRSFALGDDLTGARLGMSVLGNDADRDRAIAQAGAMFDRALEESSTIMESKSLERAFLGAIRFMLAHEAGHVALGHSTSPANCDEALANEAAADRYAVLVSDLADYGRIPGIIVARGATDHSVQFVTPLESMVTDPSDGAHQFFGFAYGLAGLDTRLRAVPGCSYPAPELRLAEIQPLANVIDSVHDLAVTDQYLRRFGARDTKQRVGTGRFDMYFPRLQEIATAEKPFPADLAPLRDQLSEVYYDTFRREN
ncbi:hypothetical protein HZY97_03960 [Sphingomonas sp. R-74633]|uniref:hypothetical protein n=1 Tax=Sphingomonas sp. R-74633 TaxID=2751188 RepID=UPI0015D3EAEE|nr:hypothetical protein [Sphingomonas sp. R-74633]NYT39900.1 hypothetical protein [Sphingomonas sp. R-74633]